jgi:hypothetical protein
MTIWERVQAALSILSIPMGQSVYIPATPGAWPNLYLVYLSVDGVPAMEADDAEIERRYRVQVSIYSRTGLANLPNIDGAMIAAGFQKGPERELPYDHQTRHFGLAKDYFYLEQE